MRHVIRWMRAMAAAVVCGGLLVALPAPPAQAALPTGGMTAAQLNTAFGTYGDTSGKWSGGDATTSIALPDGRDAWFFSDTLLGTVNADHSRPTSSPFIHNSIVVQDGTSLVSTRYGGTASAPDSLVKPSDGSSDYYWVADGAVEGSVLRMFYQRMRATGTGSLDFTEVGTALVTYSLPALTVQSVVDLSLSSSIAWGSAVLQDGGYTYIYGSESTPSAVRFAHLARVPQGGLTGAWQFWTGSTWSSSEADSARLLSGVGTGFGVQRVGSQVVLITEDTNLLFNPDVVAYTATAPTGPFAGPIELFTAPEPAQRDGNIVYDARLHPELAGSGKLLVSYNVNNLTSSATYEDATIYRPRFVDITWPRPQPDPATLPAAPTGLTASADTTGTVHLSWQAPAGTGLTYSVYRRDVTLGQTNPARVLKGATTTDLNVPGFYTTGHTYEFQVTAVNSAGEGPPSAIATVTVTVAPPAAPTGVTATVTGDGAVNLSWNAVPYAWRYDVYQRDVTAGDTEFVRQSNPSPAATGYTASSLINHDTYEFYVTATHGGGESPASAKVSGTANYPVPAAPTGLTATPQSDGTIQLTWTDAEPNRWFNVYQRDVTAGETDFTQLPLPITTCCTMTAGYLADDHTYEFKVTATSQGGESAPSAVASATSNYPAPSAPTNLTAAAGDGQVVLTWSSAGDDVWYNVYQRDLTTGETTFTQLPLPVTTCCTMTAGYLSNTHTYEFKITATTAGGESAASNTVQATPMAPLPAAPTGLTATPQSDGTIALSWTAPAADLWYNVYQKDVTAGGDWAKLPLPVTSGTSLTAGYLTNGHTYQFKVAATNATGEGPVSNVAQAVCAYAPPAAPTNLRGYVAGAGTIDLDWDPPGDSLYYWIYWRDVTANQTSFTKSIYPTDQTHASMSYLSDAHVYEFKVTAENAGGDGPASATVRVTARGGVPVAPTGLTATAGDGQAQLSWTASTTSGVSYVVFQRDVTKNQSWQQLPLPITSCCTMTAGYLANGDTYQFKLLAANSVGQSSASNVASARPMPPSPQAPSGLSASAGDGQVKLSWTASPTSNVLYNVYQRDATTGSSWQKLPLPVTGTSMTAAYLANGDTYQFKVTATNLSGESAASNVASARPLPPIPSAPSNLSATPGDMQVKLSWTASSSKNVWYWIEYKTSSASSWSRLKYPVTTCCSFTVTYLANATTYSFRVRATNLAGDSSPSNTATAKPMPPFPKAPSNLYVSSTGVGKVYLSFTASPTARVLYWVYFRLAGDFTWTRAGLPLSVTSIEMTGGFYQGEVEEFKVTAANQAGESTASNTDNTVVLEARSEPRRSGNQNNGTNALAQLRAGGASCEAGEGQTVCFNIAANGSGQPMTVGDYLLYPGSWSDLHTRLNCEAYKRANLRYEFGRNGANDLGPDLLIHEAGHSWQESRYGNWTDFLGDYIEQSLGSYARWGNPWQGNAFELGADLYWGGYWVAPSGRYFDSGGSSCDWLY